jgi:hypothetical protein
LTQFKERKWKTTIKGERKEKKEKEKREDE